MNGYDSYISGNVLPKYDSLPKREDTVHIVKKKKSKAAINRKLFYKVYMIGLFAAIFTIVFRFTIITEMNSQIVNLNKELAKLDKDVQQSSVYLESMTDLNTVQQVAVSQLNMDTPQQHQVVTLDLNMGDKAVSADASTVRKSTFFKGFVSKCLEYLY